MAAMKVQAMDFSGKHPHKGFFSNSSSLIRALALLGIFQGMQLLAAPDSGLPLFCVAAFSGETIIASQQDRSLDQAEPELAELKMRFRKFVAYAEFLHESMASLSGDFVTEMKEIEALARDEKVLKAKFRVLQLEQKYLGGLDTLSGKFAVFMEEIRESHKRGTEMLVGLKDKLSADIYMNHLRAIDNDKNRIDELHSSFVEKESFVRESYKGLRQIFDALRYEHGALIYKMPAGQSAGDQPKTSETPSIARVSASRQVETPVPAAPVRPAPAKPAPVKPAPAKPLKTAEAVKEAAVKPSESKPQVKKVAETVKNPEVKYPVVSFQELEERVPANTSFTRPFCVTIENHPGARPQSGLQLADIVYEFLAEGGITRFLGVYTAASGILGPVRSCRHYFTDIVGQYDAIYVHCGSSNQGLQALAARKIDFMNEIKFSKPFYRVKFRSSPHNLYTTLEKLILGADKMGFRARGDVIPPAEHFPRFSETLKSPKPEKLVKVIYHRKYSVAYSYDEKSNRYLRMINSAPHTIYGEGTQLSTPNILVISCPTRQIDSYGRLDIDLTGSGPAMAIRGGQSQICTWHKKDSRSPMTILDPQGKPVLFNPGQIWIQVIKEGCKTLPPMDLSGK